MVDIVVVVVSGEVKPTVSRKDCIFLLKLNPRDMA